MQPNEFVYSTYIRTTPEKLWEALTRGDFTEKYWFGFHAEIELKTGGAVRIAPPASKEKKDDCSCSEGITGQVLECIPHRKLVYTWGTKDNPEVAAKRNGPSRVTFELIPMGPQVKLRLIHENLLPEDVEKNPNKFQGINNGWPAVISSLKSLLETGQAIVFSA